MKAIAAVSVNRNALVYKVRCVKTEEKGRYQQMTMAPIMIQV